MPRDVPGLNSIYPFLARARKCSSAALADAKPKRFAISARVGGRPLSSIATVIRPKISSCLAVSLGKEASSRSVTVFIFILGLYTVKISISRTFVRLDNVDMTDLSNKPMILLIGMGGTIAGLQVNGGGQGYLAGQVPIETLSEQIKCKLPIKNIQLSNIDSCDMTEALLSQLGQKIVEALQDPHIVGIVMTHGTDTMEETALFLELVCGYLAKAVGKKVIITGAMLPADHPEADGPDNLNKAVALVEDKGAPSGVFGVMGGKVFPARNMSKRHTSSIDTFVNSEALHLDQGRQPKDSTKVSEDLPIPSIDNWPRVEIVTNHIGAKGDQIEVYKKLGVQGIVLAGTGGGTVHHDLNAGLEAFMKDGGALVRSSRVGLGKIPSQLSNGRLSASLGAGDLNPPKARIALQLALFASLDAKANALSWQDIFARIVG